MTLARPAHYATLPVPQRVAVRQPLLDARAGFRHRPQRHTEHGLTDDRVPRATSQFRKPVVHIHEHPRVPRQDRQGHGAGPERLAEPLLRTAQRFLHFRALLGFALEMLVRTLQFLLQRLRPLPRADVRVHLLLQPRVGDEQLARAFRDLALQFLLGGPQRGVAGLHLGNHLVKAIHQLAEFVLAVLRRAQRIIFCRRNGARGFGQFQNRPRDEPLQTRGQQIPKGRRRHDDEQPHPHEATVAFPHAAEIALEQRITDGAVLNHDGRDHLEMVRAKNHLARERPRRGGQGPSPPGVFYKDIAGFIVQDCCAETLLRLQRIQNLLPEFPVIEAQRGRAAVGQNG